MSDDRIRELELELELRNRQSGQIGATHQGPGFQAKPVKQGGGLPEFGAGILQGLGNIGRGVKQRAVEIGTSIGAVPPFVPSRLRAEEEAIREQRTYDPSDTVAAQLGRFTGETIPAVPIMAAPVGQTLAGSTLGSAALGALYGSLLPTTSNLETTANMTVGGVGAGAGNLVSRAMLPTGARTMTQGQKDVLNIARREGIPLRTSEATGSAAIKNYEQMAANRPATAGMEKRFNERQTAAINRAITRRLGKEVDELSPDQLKAFGDEIGGRVGAAVKGKDVDLTGDFFNSLIKIESEYSQGGKLTMTPDIKKLVDDALDTIVSKRNVSGEVAQSIKSRLQYRMRDAFNSDKSELGNALRNLADGLDDAIGKTMSKDELAAWTKARRQYANYKAVEDIMTRPTRQGAEADIPVRNLASALERQFSGSYAKGGADLAGVARLGQVIQPPGRSALLGESGLPIVRNAQDLARVVTMPPLQSRVMQDYLTGALPLQSLLRDYPIARTSNDAMLRALGLNLGAYDKDK